MSEGLVTVFGGSGFLGRHLVAQLARSGRPVRIAVRRPEKALFLKPMGSVGQIDLVQANLRHEGSVVRAVEGASSVVNLAGILFQAGAQRFDGLHADGAERVARAAAAAGAERLVQVSAIGAAEDSPAQYASSKAVGEAAVLGAFPQATIIRPSLLIGPDDNFFNRFARLSRVTPVLPLIGGGHTRFQPAYVADVAAAVAATLGDSDSAGRTYELGGPQVYSFRELMELMMSVTGQKRLLIPVPFAIARFEAWFMQMPSAIAPFWPPLLTVDQVNLLETDNVVARGMPGFADLGVEPRSIESILPSYLGRFRDRGQFAAQEPAP